MISSTLCESAYVISDDGIDILDETPMTSFVPLIETRFSLQFFCLD